MHSSGRGRDLPRVLITHFTQNKKSDQGGGGESTQMFKQRTKSRLSPQFLEVSNAQISKDGDKTANISMSSGSNRRIKSSPSPSSRHRSSRESGDRSDHMGGRDVDGETSLRGRISPRGESGERRQRPSKTASPREASTGVDGLGSRASPRLEQQQPQASSARSSRSGRGRDGGSGKREGKGERSKPASNPPPPSSTSNNIWNRPPRDRVMSSSSNRSVVMKSPREGERTDGANAAARSPLASPPSFGRINDESVQLDHLPMADLMVYLQLVANNSSNLPLTRRDDPELGRTVSSLTPEEYATKCEAFVPSMVRIFGGQYGKYGSVWDLKTSEEFDVTSSTREPGISHGGAVCNALLKAMYDTESDVNIASPQHIEAKDLFDDDDDETINTGGFTVDGTLNSFDTLVLNDGTNASTMTWAQLLRKMKPEMQGVGFNQVPAVTSSYRLNLNEPFSLVPPDFKKGVNQKRALLIGCNYRKAPNVELKACHDDVRSVKDFLVNVYGFPESSDSMTVLMDDKKHQKPTHTNITNAFKNLAEKSQPGDAVFVLFTGHGCRVLDSPIDETAESYDEAMVPSDYEETGLIRDTLFFKTLLAPMRKGVMVTCIIDCCHTGIMFDLPYLFTTKGDKGEPLPKMSLNNDFSFVRFLKVVKTLYESSVFTRIGKTVGNELDKQAPIKDDDTMETADSLETVPETEQPILRKSFFDMLCSPAAVAQNIINCTLQSPDEFSDDEHKNSMEDDNSCYSYGS
ncbi:hypothetical protein ACHAW5_002672 [Stephanodiscus triporus]|uniref:Peptidase C14 caspase domain-containing protein n=1 Tax=Stephanodiscus triporus TaxID=2934178 RepID=A0ABD3N3D7_9STRA